MWDDPDWNSYVEFYVVVTKRLRAEFPNVKISGPALTHADLGMIGRLADRCREEGAPLDFVSWHSYPKTPEEVLNPPFAVRKLLDEKGFEKTELHLNEWRYFPCEWSEIHGTEGRLEEQRILGQSGGGAARRRLGGVQRVCDDALAGRAAYHVELLRLRSR